MQSPEFTMFVSTFKFKLDQELHDEEIFTLFDLRFDFGVGDGSDNSSKAF
jgi:hypothetical protein